MDLIYFFSHKPHFYYGPPQSGKATTARILLTPYFGEIFHQHFDQVDTETIQTAAKLGHGIIIDFPGCTPSNYRKLEKLVSLKIPMIICALEGPPSGIRDKVRPVKFYPPEQEVIQSKS